jgi:hypothetical protein
VRFGIGCLDRQPQGDDSRTVLGSWCATVRRWRRPASLLVDEVPLLPAVLPLAPDERVITCEGVFELSAAPD